MRPIRFATSAAGAADRATLLASARQAEEFGYSTFAVADHFMLPFAPLIALQAVADATSTLRIGQKVLAQGFRHPAVLAKELATLDVLSEGRLEVGIGAGWMQAEFEQAGMQFETASVRIEQLEEAVTVLKGLFGDEPCTFAGKHFNIKELNGTPKPVQRPHPPVMIGGGSPKLLAAAARCADIIQVLPGSQRGQALLPADLTARKYREKVDWIRGAAGDRFDDIELGAALVNVTITDEPERAADEFLTRLAPSVESLGPSRDELLSSPVVAIGSVEQVCDKLLATRDSFGFSYFALLRPMNTTPGSLVSVIERLAGS